MSILGLKHVVATCFKTKCTLIMTFFYNYIFANSLLQGAERLGYTPEKIPRNVKDCVDCGHCCHGCPYEAKQSTLTALLEPLMLANAPTSNNLHILPHCTATRVLYASESVGSVQSADGTPYPAKHRAVGVEATVRVHKRSSSGLSVGERLKQLQSDEDVQVRYVDCDESLYLY